VSSVASFMRFCSANSARYRSVNSLLDCAAIRCGEKSSGINRQRCFRRNSERAFLQICGSARNGNVSPLLIRKASGRLFPAQPAFNSRLVLMVPPDCGKQHVNIKEIGHGGNCSSALKISSREIGRPMESSECFPFRRMIRTLFRGFRFGRSIRTNTRRPSPSGRTFTTSPVSMRASFRAFAGITICPRP
jgi:hypothetical protein